MPDVILFVDDEPEVLAILKRTFPERDGYQVLTASGGDEALTILKAREVDLLVTDQRMPGMTGIELAAEARRLHPGMTVILLTAYTDPRDLIDAINKGEVYRYLTKPWEYVDLRQAVLRALEQVKLRREQARLDAELERRIAALEVAAEIARDVGLAESRQALLELLLKRLPRVVAATPPPRSWCPRGRRLSSCSGRWRRSPNGPFWPCARTRWRPGSNTRGRPCSRRNCK